MMQYLYICLFTRLIALGNLGDLTWEIGGFKVPSAIKLVLQANRLIKCANHPQQGFRSEKHVFTEKISKITLS